jgi:hypothetical protein
VTYTCTTEKDMNRWLYNHTHRTCTIFTIFSNVPSLSLSIYIYNYIYIHIYIYIYTYIFIYIHIYIYGKYRLFPLHGKTKKVPKHQSVKVYWDDTWTTTVIRVHQVVFIYDICIHRIEIKCDKCWTKVRQLYAYVIIHQLWWRSLYWITMNPHNTHETNHVKIPPLPPTYWIPS